MSRGTDRARGSEHGGRTMKWCEHFLSWSRGGRTANDVSLSECVTRWQKHEVQETEDRGWGWTVNLKTFPQQLPCEGSQTPQIVRPP